jgi:hypothetical protein
VLVFADVLDDLLLARKFGIVFKAFYELAKITQVDLKELNGIIFVFNSQFGHFKLKFARNVPKLFLITLDLINRSFDFPMNVIIIRRIEIPPKNVFLVSH